jgi:hypothetical protein
MVYFKVVVQTVRVPVSPQIQTALPALLSTEELLSFEYPEGFGTPEELGISEDLRDHGILGPDAESTESSEIVEENIGEAQVSAEVLSSFEFSRRKSF